MSKYLFVTTDVYKKRAIEINQDPRLVFNVGALSIDNLKEQDLFSKEEFQNIFNIDLKIPYILSTFHPETVSFQNNEKYIDELIDTFEILKKKYAIIVTMPNSDTMGDMIRIKLERYAKVNSDVKLIESFGMRGYLTCMKYCEFMIGNTSSGFVEASYFPKWVINLGDRQKGRSITKNIINSKINKLAMLKAIGYVESNALPADANIYGNGNASGKIVNIIKEIYELK